MDSLGQNVDGITEVAETLDRSGLGLPGRRQALGSPEGFSLPKDKFSAHTRRASYRVIAQAWSKERPKRGFGWFGRRSWMPIGRATRSAELETRAIRLLAHAQKLEGLGHATHLRGVHDSPKLKLKRCNLLSYRDPRIRPKFFGRLASAPAAAGTPVSRPNSSATSYGLTAVPTRSLNCFLTDYRRDNPIARFADQLV